MRASWPLNSNAKKKWKIRFTTTSRGKRTTKTSGKGCAAYAITEFLLDAPSNIRENGVLGNIVAYRVAVD